MSDLDAQIKSQGDKVRELKSAKAGKDAITAEVNVLLALKAKYKVDIFCRMLMIICSMRNWPKSECTPIHNSHLTA